MDFAKYFDMLTQQEAMMLLALWLIAFLIGFLLGWLIWGSRARKYRKLYEESQEALKTAKAENESLSEELALKQSDLKKATLEVDELREKLLLAQQENDQLYKDLLNANQQVEELQAINSANATTIEDLNDQILGLKTRYNQLASEEGAEGIVLGNVAEFQDNFEETANRLKTLEDKLAHLEGENDALKLEVQDLKTTPADPPVTKSVGNIEFGASPEEEQEEEVEIAGEKAVLKEVIVVSEEDASDDLTLISGIGSFLEKKLHANGVNSFEQICGWDTAEVARMTELIGHLPGRIEKDNWVGQACELAKKKKTDPMAFAKSVKPKIKPDDLKVVEGIGPKIESIFKAAGINTLSELAATTSDRLREILQEAGKRYRMHDPTTWPEQASLAAAGDLEKLKELQDALMGGREAS